jgi:hypothetical protein
LRWKKCRTARIISEESIVAGARLCRCKDSPVLVRENRHLVQQTELLSVLTIIQVALDTITWTRFIGAGWVFRSWSLCSRLPYSLHRAGGRMGRRPLTFSSLSFTQL